MTKNWNKIGKYLHDRDLFNTYVKLIRLLELHFKADYREVQLIQDANEAFQHVLITLWLPHGTPLAIAYNTKTEALKLMGVLGLTAQHFAIKVQVCNSH